MTNNRPISLLSTSSKVLEKVMHNRLNHYLQNNNILVPEEFGFRKGMSTEDATFKLADSVSKSRNEKMVEYSMILQKLLIVQIIIF
jgi:hypothetical protein